MGVEGEAPKKMRFGGAAVGWNVFHLEVRSKSALDTWEVRRFRLILDFDAHKCTQVHRKSQVGPILGVNVRD